MRTTVDYVKRRHRQHQFSNSCQISDVPANSHAGSHVLIPEIEHSDVIMPLKIFCIPQYIYEFKICFFFLQLFRLTSTVKGLIKLHQLLNSTPYRIRTINTRVIYYYISTKYNNISVLNIYCIEKWWKRANISYKSFNHISNLYPHKQDNAFSPHSGLHTQIQTDFALSLLSSRLPYKTLVCNGRQVSGHSQAKAKHFLRLL